MRGVVRATVCGPLIRALRRTHDRPVDPPLRFMRDAMGSAMGGAPPICAALCVQGRRTRPVTGERNGQRTGPLKHPLLCLVHDPVRGPMQGAVEDAAKAPPSGPRRRRRSPLYIYTYVPESL